MGMRYEQDEGREVTRYKVRWSAPGTDSLIDWWKKRGFDPNNIAVDGMDYRWPFLIYREFILDENGGKIIEWTGPEDSDGWRSAVFLTNTRRRFSPFGPPWFLVRNRDR